MLFDSHAHINNETFTDDEREALIREIEASDVSYVMDVGFNLESSEQAIKDANAHDWCYSAVGVHPYDTKEMTEEIYEKIKELTNEPKVMAIGEIGLDFHDERDYDDKQRYWFKRQIALANELHLPIIVHSRDADQETMDILKEAGAFSEERCEWFTKNWDSSHNMGKDPHVLLHCFSGSKELAEQYLKLGATLSIAGPVTFKNNRKTVEVVENVPIERLLIETDSPYLTPVPHRGEQNKSPYVEFTARKIAEIKNMPYEEVCKITLENAKRFFNIK